MEKLAVINMARTGRNIAALRLQQGMSVRALQQVFGFATPQAIYKWQNGVSLPTVDNLVIFPPCSMCPSVRILATDE